MYTDVLLRLTELPGADTSCIGDSLQEAVRLLTTAEAALGDCVYIYISAYTNDASANAGRPHRANSALHANPDPSFTLDLWSICAENLWRASMQMDTKSSVWEELSARLLFWRSIAGTQASPMSEWLRREVVRILQTSI
jgi:nucleolar pre-ribosomal-associated protein 1